MSQKAIKRIGTQKMRTIGRASFPPRKRSTYDLKKQVTLGRVDTRTAGLRKLVASLYSVADVPSTLFHYTSIGGLLGILEDQALWASELRYLNDSAELTYGYELLLSEVRARKVSSSQNAEMLTQLENWLAHRSRFGPMVFVAAFTRNGNLLSQWRAYCPPAGGVSFGISSAHLSKVCKANRFSLARCVYTADEHQKLVARLIKHVVAATKLTGPNGLAPREESFYSTFCNFEESIIRVCAVMKHSAFQEEAEWRAVCSSFSDLVGDEGTNINYRAGSSMLIPYIQLPLADSNGIIPIDEVVTGPAPDQAAAEGSIQRLVAKHIRNLHWPWKSRYCDIPYRAW